MLSEAQRQTDIATRVIRVLKGSGYPPLRRIEAVACGARIILRGSVPSYYLKQLAQQKAMEVKCVETVTNDLIVTATGKPVSRR